MSVGVFLLGLLSLMTLMLFGFLTTSLLAPPGTSRGLRWAFAPAVGAGICSIVFVLFRRPMFTIELALLAGLVAAYFSVRKPALRLGSFYISPLPASWMLLAVACGIAISQWSVVIEREPHGDWDATAIWNSHSRYLYRDGPAWQSDIRNTFHSDYPLLVPALVARLWRYIGNDVPDAGGVSGAMFVLAAVAVLAGVLAELRASSAGVVMALVLLGTPFYIHYGVAQSADVPLSLYILCTAALICLYRMRSSESRGLLVLAGFTAGCAGWVKNEGLLFLVVVGLVLLLPVLWEPSVTLRRFAAFACGGFLPLLVIVWFKMAVAPPNDIFGYRHYSEIMQKLSDPSRHLTIFQNFSRTFWSFGEWLVHPAVFVLLYVALHGIDRKTAHNAGWLQSVLIWGLVVAGYYAVYVITPMDLQWHLDSSLPRLYLHLWPTALLLTGLAVKPANAPVR